MGWMNSISDRISNYVSYKKNPETITTAEPAEHVKDSSLPSLDQMDAEDENNNQSESNSQIDDENGDDEFDDGPDTSSLSAFLLSFISYPSTVPYQMKDDESSVEDNDDDDAEELSKQNINESTARYRHNSKPLDDSTVNKRSKPILSRWMPGFSVWRTKKEETDEPSSPKTSISKEDGLDEFYSPASTPRTSPLHNGHSHEFSFQKNGYDVHDSAGEVVSPLRLPKMSDESIILNDRWRSLICSSLPALVIGREWILLYSTSKHGISLHTLYRKSMLLPGPCLIVVNDKEGNVLGGLSSGPLIASTRRKYQGSNDTFVFSDVSGLPVLFKSTGANRYFILCMNDSLSFGGGGHFALSLDEELLNGSSGFCETFNNPCLSNSEEFVIKHVELWGFAHVSRYTPKSSVWHEPDPNLSIHSL